MSGDRYVDSVRSISKIFGLHLIAMVKGLLGKMGVDELEAWCSNLYELQVSLKYQSAPYSH